LNLECEILKTIDDPYIGITTDDIVWVLKKKI
jgi:hypothetical protein